MVGARPLWSKAAIRALTAARKLVRAAAVPAVPASDPVAPAAFSSARAAAAYAALQAIDDDAGVAGPRARDDLPIGASIEANTRAIEALAAEVAAVSAGIRGIIAAIDRAAAWIPSVSVAAELSGELSNNSAEDDEMYRPGSEEQDEECLPDSDPSVYVDVAEVPD